MASPKKSKKNPPSKRMNWYNAGSGLNQALYGVRFYIGELRKISPATLKKAGVTPSEFAAIRNIQRKFTRLNQQVTLGELEVV